MAQYNDTTSLNGITKQVYGDKLEKIAFEMGIIRRLVEFSDSAKLGDKFHFPVLLAMEQGVTYNGTAGSVVTLATPIAAVTKDASLMGSEIISRAQIAYKAITTAVAQGPKAFENATKLVLENLSDTSQKRLEASLLRGQDGLGTVLTNTSGVLAFTTGTWSAATWADMEGAILEAWDGITATQTQHNGDLTISAVDFDAQTITVTGTSTNVVANDVLYFKGARTSTAYNEMIGINKILTATTGTVFGIDVAAYSRWRANNTSSFGAVSMGKYLEQVRKVVNRGFKGKLTALMPSQAYEVLNSDLAALRRYDGSYSRTKGVAGNEAIEFHCQAGIIEIMVHPMLLDGDSYIIPASLFKRVGSSDISFKVDGAGDGEIFFHRQDVNAYEARTYADQAVICQRPSHCVRLTGITYS